MPTNANAHPLSYSKNQEKAVKSLGVEEPIGAQVKLVNFSWIDFHLEQIVKTQMIHQFKINFDDLSTELDKYVKPAGGAARAAGLARSCEGPFAGMSKQVEAQLQQRCSDAAPPRLQGRFQWDPSISWQQLLSALCLT